MELGAECIWVPMKGLIDLVRTVREGFQKEAIAEMPSAGQVDID